MNDSLIRFNGIEADGNETFLLRRDQSGFEFCKTARKPYDTVVVKVLRAVKETCPNWLRLGSDGEKDIFDIPLAEHEEREL